MSFLKLYFILNCDSNDVMPVIKGSYFAPQPAPTFAIVTSDLIEWFTVEAIEQREIVVDPLCAVPSIPFGH